MNIISQICGIIVLVVLIYSYLRQRSIKIGSKRVYLAGLFISLLCLIFDIGSLYCIDHLNTLPLIVVETACKIYICLLCWICYFGLQYILTDNYYLTYTSDDKKKLKIRQIFHLVIIIISNIIILLLPIYFHNEGAYYTYGPSTMLTYIICFYFMLNTVLEIVRSKGRINPNRRNTVISWMAIWITGALIQFFFPEVLCVSFASVVGLVLIGLILENGQSNIDKRSGLFSYGSLQSTVDICFATNTPLSLIMIDFPIAQSGIDDNTNVDTAHDQFGHFLSTKKDLTAFITLNNRYIILFKKNADMVATSPEIIRALHNILCDNNVNTSILKPGYITMDDTSILNNSREFFNILRMYQTIAKKISYSNNVNDNVNDIINNNSYDTNIDANNSSDIYNNSNIDFYIIDDDTVSTYMTLIKTKDIIIDAIANDKVEVFYQPIFNARNQRFTSAEALARIRLDDGSLLYPNNFITIAEETGLIEELSKCIFKKVFEFILINNLTNYDVHYIEINVSVKQCENPSFADDFIEMLSKYMINPAYINLEITETASLKKEDIVFANMQKLVEYGITFSLDDFGTGSSNLDYLINMPVSIVKYDRTLMLAYQNNEKAKCTIRNITKMAHELGLYIVAEGIEDQSMLDQMIGHRVDYIQGYYFSRPIPPTEYLEFITKYNVY